MGYTTVLFIFCFLPFSILIVLSSQLIKKEIITNALIIILSAAFYAWSGLNVFTLLIVYASFIYLCGNQISYSHHKKAWLVLSVVSSVLILAFFKYYGTLLNLFNLNSQQMLDRIIVPAGLSFIVFEGISYVADIYNGKAKSGTFTHALLFFLFFPKILSGPIIKWKDFQPQIHYRQYSLESVSQGINLIIIGLAKKAIIADSLGSQLALINQEIEIIGADSVTYWLRALFFALQLYYDFSGYSDIAIGISQVFGFSFSKNFDHPYRSRSISEFWRRWHISLGEWFKEYVYIPLGGNRSGNVYVNLFIVFLLTGIWHGDDSTFLIWGIMNGLLVVFERYIRKIKWYQIIPDGIKWITCLILVLLMWVMFMSPDINSAVYSYKMMFVSTNSVVDYSWRYYLNKRMIIIILIVIALESEMIKSVANLLKKAVKPLGLDIVNKLFMILLFFLDILFIINTSYSPFIYFSF